MPKKVLIVEDNDLNLKLFRDLLEANGYETVETKVSSETVELDRLREQSAAFGTDLKIRGNLVVFFERR